jgi:hypothetical protein
VARLNAQIAEALAAPEVSGRTWRASTLGPRPARPELDSALRADIDVIGALVHDAHLKLD